jgi:hypothetical protein
MSIPASVRALAAYNRSMDRYRDPADRLMIEVAAVMAGKHPSQVFPPARGQVALSKDQLIARAVRLAVGLGLDEELARDIVADTIGEEE